MINGEITNIRRTNEELKTIEDYLLKKEEAFDEELKQIDYEHAYYGLNEQTLEKEVIINALIDKILKLEKENY